MQYFVSYEVVIFSYNHFNFKAKFRRFLSGFVVGWETEASVWCDTVYFHFNLDP